MVSSKKQGKSLPVSIKDSGKDYFAVTKVPANKDILRVSEHKLIALVLAQQLAVRDKEPGEYKVTAHYKYGDPVEVYSVKRAETKTVYTTVINRVDS